MTNPDHLTRVPDQIQPGIFETRRSRIGLGIASAVVSLVPDSLFVYQLASGENLNKIPGILTTEIIVGCLGIAGVIVATKSSSEESASRDLYMGRTIGVGETA